MLPRRADHSWPFWLRAGHPRVGRGSNRSRPMRPSAARSCAASRSLAKPPRRCLRISARPTPPPSGAPWQARRPDSRLLRRPFSVTRGSFVSLRAEPAKGRSLAVRWSTSASRREPGRPISVWTEGIKSAPADRLLTDNLAAKENVASPELRVDSRLERVRKRMAGGRPHPSAIISE